MRPIRQLFGKSSWYFARYVLAGVAGFVTFPVWTRFLTVAEYGIFNLINVSLYFVMALSKCGMQKAATRFFAEFQAGKRRESISVYYTTILGGVLLTSTIVIVVITTGLGLIGPDWVGGTEIYRTLQLAALLGLFQTLEGILISFLTVEQRAKQVTFWSVLQRYATFAVGLLCAATIMKGVAGAIFGALLVEIAIVATLTAFLIWEKKLSLTGFSTGFFKECIMFGAPLGLAELSNVFLNVGDRYFIGIFLGTEAVGLYSAAYNMTNSAASLLAMPLTLALPPMIMETWESAGAKGTKRFLGSTMDLYLMVATPCIAALTFYGTTLMESFASSRYSAGAGLLPYLALPIILYGANTIYSAGLFITKRSFALMSISLIATCVNVLMNFFLIPRIGVTGAGVATLGAYAVTISLMLAGAPGTLRPKVNVPALMRYIAASTGMVIWLRLSGWNSVPGVIATIMVGGTLYLSLLIALDKSLRRLLGDLFKATHNSLRLQVAKYTS